MNSAGVMYQKGQGVPMDYDQAMAWFQKGAEEGSSSTAMYNIGVMYELGLGVDADPYLAEQWFKKSEAQQGQDTGNGLKNPGSPGRLPAVRP